MLGTYLIAVTGYFGFMAPVLARQAPATLDTTIQYPPVVVSSGVAAITFIVGYALFGIAMTRTATLPPIPQWRQAEMPKLSKCIGPPTATSTPDSVSTPLISGLRCDHRLLGRSKARGLAR